MRRTLILAIATLSAGLLFACGSQPQTPQQQKQGQQGIPPMGKPVVEAPEAVKGKWTAVVVLVEDKGTKKTEEHTIKLGEKLTLPGSNMTIEAKEFFPSFLMQGSTITSASNETNNPAALVVVNDGGAEIFNGWLFARYPTTHAFTHPRYTLTLKEGVPK